MTRHLATMSRSDKQSYFSIHKFRQINGPIIDIRSPDEYNKGHWPNAINIPLFSNEERAKIGIRGIHKWLNRIISRI